MKDLIKKTLKINQGFPIKMKTTARFIDLVEEIGELANAILSFEKLKLRDKKEKIADIKDSIADVLYDLIVLADLYQIDIEKEYKKMLKRLEKRQKKGFKY